VITWLTKTVGLAAKQPDTDQLGVQLAKLQSSPTMNGEWEAIGQAWRTLQVGDHLGFTVLLVLSPKMECDSPKRFNGSHVWVKGLKSM
jgi:hypothetical protein